jgi:ribonuclease-3
LSSFWSRPGRRKSQGRGVPGDGETLRDLIDALSPEALEGALRHSSWTPNRLESYERRAFLGDSVLGLAVASSLFDRFPELDAGELTKILNQAVSGPSCAKVGIELGVPELLRAADTGRGEGHRTSAEDLIAAERPLPEMTEAVIASCFLEFGYERTAAAVVEAFAPRIEEVRSTRTDFKSALQEAVAARGGQVEYEVVATSGPAHDRTYEVVATVEGKTLGRGRGRSKKAAGQAAAERALADLDV